jgi:hypothetical protein
MTRRELRSARVKWILHELVEDRFEVQYVDIYGAQSTARNI